MKNVFILGLLMAPALSLAESSGKNAGVSAEWAATIVRQPGVEKCLSVVENNAKGVAYFNSIKSLGSILRSDSSVSIYKLSGSNLYGDVMAGSWEIDVTMTSNESGMDFDCKVTKNEE